ncbi:MAG: TolC family protein, partial [Bacillota bacterium]
MVRGPILLALFLSACAIGPDYQRPAVDLPKDYGVAQSPSPAAERWWTLFNDPVLERLIDEALANNRDLRAAAARIEASRAQVAIARSSLFPDVGLEADRTRNLLSGDTAQVLPGTPLKFNTNRLVLRASWELDFWGKYRRA